MCKLHQHTSLHTHAQNVHIALFLSHEYKLHLQNDKHMHMFTLESVVHVWYMCEPAVEGA